jgi:hypothetical protein
VCGSCPSWAGVCRLIADEEGNGHGQQYGLSADYPAETLVTVTLADQGGKTLLTLRHAGLPSGEGSDMTEAGWRSQLDRRPMRWDRL